MYVLLRQEIIKILAQDLIHGDLSEFNILLGANGPVIIDFPQVVTAAKNSQSEKYFRRDWGTCCGSSPASIPRSGKHANDADEIWREYVRRDLSAGFVPSGRVQHHQHRPPAAPRARWASAAAGPGAGTTARAGSAGAGAAAAGAGAAARARAAAGRAAAASRAGHASATWPQGQNPQQPRADRPQGQNPQQPRADRPQGQQNQRRGPEVVFRGPAPARPDSGGGAPRKSHGGRRRPPRRF